MNFMISSFDFFWLIYLRISWVYMDYRVASL